MIGLRQRTISSWNQQKLDLGGCVLYLPFWRPDMVERYGRLVDNSGVSSLPTLVLGAANETITVTGAGTFNIYLPYPVTGTATSGTATLVGSPVSLVAGLNTVDTGVTTGTFTIAKTRVLSSRDSTRHLATVTGALWRLNGREFNGTDGWKISIPDQSYWSFTGDKTLVVWAKYTATASWWINAILAQSEGSGGNKKWYFSYNATTTKTIFHTHDGLTGTDIESDVWTRALNTWYQLCLTRIGSTWTFYKDGVANGTVSNAVVSVAISAPLVLGWGEGVGSLDGTIGEVLIYDGRALTAEEIQQNYLRTKWRYQ